MKKLGIEIDFTNVMASAIGVENGLTESDLSNFKNVADNARKAVEKDREAGKLGFMKLPYKSDEELEKIIDVAEQIAKNYSDFVVLGIGGSALGNIALHSALNHPFYNQLQNESRPRLYVLDNVDPEYINALLDVLPLQKTFFNVISKSGTTAETMSQFLIFRQLVVDRIGSQAFSKQFLATTDPKNGVMRKIADQEGLKTLSIPPDVGGRFSVLTPVGLLSAAVTGIDIKKLVAGARRMDEFLKQSTDPLSNPAVMNATVQYLMDKKGKCMSVMMPYVQALRDFADWYRQLLAESLGKKINRSGKKVEVGVTPVKALGATDQHSQVQLYVEGPSDKVITFIGTKNYRSEICIPEAYKDIEQLSYLSGQKMSYLIKSEQNATAVALAKNGKPSCTITLEKIDEESIGAMLYFFEYQIAVSGELYDINAFDQPGVETGKVLTYGMMGRKGYEDKKALVEAVLSERTSDTVISW